MEAKSSNSDQRKNSSKSLRAKKLILLERQARKDRSETLKVGDDLRYIYNLKLPTPSIIDAEE